jgi:hypothetical protein
MERTTRRAHLVRISERCNYELIVDAHSPEQASQTAMRRYVTADTIGRWEIGATTAEVVDVVRAAETRRMTHGA